MKRLLSILLLLLMISAACSREEATTPALEPEPAAVDSEADEVEADSESSATSSADVEVVSRIGIDPNQVSLNTQGLPYPWQANAVAATPYDASQPPGPVGLPDHIQINLGATDPTQRQPDDPIMYIIPVDAYKNLWDAAQDGSVTQSIDGIFQLTTEIPFPPPASGLPALPFEEIGGFNDLAVQVDQPISTDISATKSGYRFAGRFNQDPNPVSNEGMRYIYQGFTNDGKYLVTFFYPAATEFLPDTAGDASQEEMDQLASDAGAYLGQKATQLNALDASAWEPDLETLDDLVASLVIAGIPDNGIADQSWQLVARSDGTTEEPLGNTENYTIAFQPDGELSYVADCNSGSGVYDALGGAVGALAVELGPSTLAECGSGSYSNELVETLASAQDYAVRPGGNILELIRPADGGSLLFRNSGAADDVSPGVEQTPAAQATATDVPVLPTATPVPTAPKAKVRFAADRKKINAGECATLVWQVKNVQAVWVYPKGLSYKDFPATGEGAQEVCPEVTTTYRLRALQADGSKTQKEVKIKVNAPVAVQLPS
jgi:hypothetical protein